MSEQPIGPALRKRQLALELASLADRAGLKTEQVAQHLRCHRSQVSHFFAGRRLPDYPQLVMLLQLFDASDRLDELTALLEQAELRGWWDISGIPGWLRAYIGLEADATSVDEFALEEVPGLLQTEDYARLVLRSYYTDGKDLDRELGIRMRRQDRVGSTSLTLSVVLSQGLLERLSYLGAAGGDQLQHLILMGSKPTVTIRVLPFAAGRHDSGTGSFTVMGFPSHTTPSVGYVSYALGGHLVDDTAVVTGLQTLYRGLCVQSLDPGASRETLAQFVELADRRKP